MLRLPEGVTWIELDLPGGEAARDRRAAEHRAGRAAARAGLASLGCATTRDVASTRRGAPVFPPGFTGSITHDRGRAAALVAASSSGYAAVGADLHAARGVDERTARYVGDPQERDAARRAAGAEADDLLFALKEAVFKACCGADEWYEFADVELSFDDDGAAHLLRPSRTGVELRWAISGAVVRAAALVAAPSSVAAGGPDEGRSHR
ncbi:4'-phosphopantetheinyl transferase superfamily protein [Amnibacterium kyonggiense]